MSRLAEICLFLGTGTVSTGTGDVWVDLTQQQVHLHHFKDDLIPPKGPGLSNCFKAVMRFRMNGIVWNIYKGNPESPSSRSSEEHAWALWIVCPGQLRPLFGISRPVKKAAMVFLLTRQTE